jgi:hypothetical protein
MRRCLAGRNSRSSILFLPISRVVTSGRAPSKKMSEEGGGRRALPNAPVVTSGRASPKKTAMDCHLLPTEGLQPAYPAESASKVDGDRVSGTHRV